MKISGTEISCKIKSITVSKTIATVTLLLVSEKETIPRLGFQIGYLLDNFLIREDATVYWADIYSAIINDNSNVSIGRSKEISIKIDLSKYSFEDCMFKCKCRIVLYRYGTHDILWESEEVLLNTAPASPPVAIDLKHMFIKSKDRYRLRLDFKVHEDSWIYDASKMRVKLTATSEDLYTENSEKILFESHQINLEESTYLPITDTSYIFKQLWNDLVVLTFEIYLDSTQILYKKFRLKPGEANAVVYIKEKDVLKVSNIYGKTSVSNFPVIGRLSNPAVKDRAK